jgi:ssDNA-binding replication factor A large subunit
MEAEDVIEKIVEESELDEDEVKEEIDEKMEEFSGLVSEEGAAHLVAKEYGVSIAEEQAENLKIENIVPEMRKVQLKARVLSVSDLNTFERDDDEEDGKVQNIVLGDDTGTIRVTLWDEQTQIAEKIDEGDAIEMSGAYTVEDNQGNAELRLGDEAQVKMADEEDVPEVQSQTDTQEVPIREITTEGNSYELRGMLMKMYTSNPFYRVHPETGDTVREDEDGNYVTDDGEEVEEPEGRLAVSGVLDDGTETMRVVFFGDQAREILDVTEEEEKEMDQDAVEEAAEKAAGKQLIIQGRTRYNDYFDRLEVLANSVEESEVDDEIERMLEIMEA